jgi:hypothetical protein
MAPVLSAITSLWIYGDQAEDQLTGIANLARMGPALERGRRSLLAELLLRSYIMRIAMLSRSGSVAADGHGEQVTPDVRAPPFVVVFVSSPLGYLVSK